MRLVLLTPRGPGGVAVLRAEGGDRVARLLPFLRSRSGGTLAATDLASDRPRLLALVAGDDVIDEILFVDRVAGACSELHLHGSVAVLAAIEKVLGPLTRPGELSPADALLARAGSEAQLALALEQRRWGDLGAWLAAVGTLPAADRCAALAGAIARTRTSRALATPCRVVLFGPQNAGKSTLFNRLVLAERVLTDAAPGSTRDAVHELTFLDGYPYELVDTAGEGEATGDIDRIAQARGRALRNSAIRILVCDGSAPMLAVGPHLMAAADLLVVNKLDLPPGAGWQECPREALAVTGIDPANAPAIRAAVGAALRKLRRLDPAPPSGVGGPAALDDAEQLQLSRLALANGVDGATQDPRR